MKTCIITGASRGIGKQTALKLKKEGYNVVGTYLNSSDGAKELTEYGVDIKRCDVRSLSDVTSLFDYAEKKYGKIDVVIASAGVSPKQKPFIDATEQELLDTVNVNLLGTAYTNKLAVTKMLSSGGIILNVSSVFGVTGGSCEVIYSASKTGIVGLTRALHEEMQYSSVKVACLTLGLIDTDMNSHLSSQEKLDFCSEMGLDKVPTASDVASEIFSILSSGLNGGEIIPLFMKAD